MRKRKDDHMDSHEEKKNNLRKLSKAQLLELMVDQEDGQEPVDKELVSKELLRIENRKRFFKAIRATIVSLLCVAAVAVLLSTLVFPVIIVRGKNMEPTLEEKDIIIMQKNGQLEAGDIVAAYINNELVVKRIIALPGDWVDMDGSGNVYVNDQLLEEPYIRNKAFGTCDLVMPYQVPENRYFLMGDQRSTSLDSRSTQVGCVARKQIVGKCFLRVWPMDRLYIFN